jgi:hypothetical protein
MQYGQLNHHCAGCACAMRASGRVVELRQPVATFAPTADQGPRRRPPRR